MLKNGCSMFSSQEISSSLVPFFIHWDGKFKKSRHSTFSYLIQIPMKSIQFLTKFSKNISFELGFQNFPHWILNARWRYNTFVQPRDFPSEIFDRKDGWKIWLYQIIKNILRFVSLKFKCQVFDFCFDILDIQITQAGESVPKKSNLKISKIFKHSCS